MFPMFFYDFSLCVMIFSYLPWLSPCFSSKCPNSPRAATLRISIAPRTSSATTRVRAIATPKPFTRKAPTSQIGVWRWYGKSFLGGNDEQWLRFTPVASWYIYIMIYIYGIILTFIYIYTHLDLRKDTNNCPFARFLPLGRISCEGAGNDYCGQFWILYLSGWSYSTLRKNVSVFLGGNSREKVVNTREKGGNTRANSSWL